MLNLFMTILLASAQAVAGNSETTKSVYESDVYISDRIDPGAPEDISVDLLYSATCNPNFTREEKINFFSAFTQSKIEELKLLDFNCEFFSRSHTLPVVTLHYRNAFLEDIGKDVVQKLDTKGVSAIFVEPCELTEEEAETIEQDFLPGNFKVAEPPLPEPSRDWVDEREIEYDNFSSNPYSGYGVVIGVCELDSFYASHANFANTSITIHESSMISASPTSTHCAKVMSVLTGRYGVAPRATIHLVDGGAPSYSGYRSLDYFVVWGVDVVNYSNSSGENVDAYINYTVNTYGITVVAACLNNLSQTLGVPGCCQNVISVCSVYPNYNIASGSALYPSGFGQNFRIAAVGANRYVNVYGNMEYVSGTSFATPAVAGTIALMMEKDPSLKGNPAKVMATLGNAANQALVNHTSNSNVTDSFGSSSGLYSWCGVGALDIWKSLYYTGSNAMISYTLPSYGDYVYATFYSAQAGRTIRVTHAWLRTATQFGSSYSNVALADYDIRILDSGDNVVMSTTASSVNVEKIVYNVYTTQTYKVQIKAYATYGAPYYLYACLG